VRAGLANFLRRFSKFRDSNNFWRIGRESKFYMYNVFVYVCRLRYNQQHPVGVKLDRVIKEMTVFLFFFYFFESVLPSKDSNNFWRIGRESKFYMYNVFVYVCRLPYNQQHPFDVKLDRVIKETDFFFIFLREVLAPPPRFWG